MPWKHHGVAMSVVTSQQKKKTKTLCFMYQLKLTSGIVNIRTTTLFTLELLRALCVLCGIWDNPGSTFGCHSFRNKWIASFLSSCQKCNLIAVILCAHWFQQSILSRMLMKMPEKSLPLTLTSSQKKSSGEAENLHAVFCYMGWSNKSYYVVLYLDTCGK